MSEIPYILLRASLELFHKPPFELNQEQLKQAEGQAKREFEIESRALKSEEASGVVVSDAEVQRAFNAIRERYPDEEAFTTDLARNDLDQTRLLEALQRQCKVNTILERVAARAPSVNEVEIGIFYHSHLERFQQPERREAYHILISINPDFPDNTRESAHSRLSEIGAKLTSKPHKFGQLAQRHSECPTALNGGKLGVLPRGKLFPELDAVLFNLAEGELSGIVESPMGYHLLLCKKIHAPETISLKQASPKIRKMMKERYQRNCQRAWLSSLARTKPEPEVRDD